jgi:hypothetical protein
MPHKLPGLLAARSQHGKFGKGLIRRMNFLRSGANLAFGRLAAVVLLALLAAYPASRLGFFAWPRQYDPLAIPDLRQPPNFLTPWQLKLVDSVPENCIAALQLAGRPAALRLRWGSGANCAVPDGISVRQLDQARVRPEDMRCAIAARLMGWERHVLQPAAQRLFGEPVVEILHFGSYSCRLVRGGTSMSQHATANAFDISGFRLASGKIISLKRDWGKRSNEGKLLYIARDGLCDWFNATLSSDYNADHADHFHVDMGWWRTCR